TGKGKDSKQKSDEGKIIHAVYWGSEDCVWNDTGGDTATLINFVTVNSVTVPPVKKD
ncbi:MAG: hypothetical protein JWR09_5209, partial [Mucilaginibacter sp.]|nr:hypothetical protein [Mucilaginibacter sp.]